MIKLLLVEDDANLCYIIRGGLEDMIGGYEVMTASNGEEGLKIWKEQHLDIIISDIEMPVMDGYEMVRRIREDASMNFEAIETLQERFNHDLDVIFLESGGDNLAATFSPDLVDFTIYIIDVAQGEKIPRKAGQGMIKSDLFLINKTDLAPYVGANLDRMREDTLHFRNEDSFIFTNLNNDDNVKEVEEWIRKNFLLEDL